MISGVENVRIIVDGIDECELNQQDAILSRAFAIVNSTKDNECKLAIFSREMDHISKHCKRNRCSCISLNDERDVIDLAIRSFVRDKMVGFRDERKDFAAPEHLFRQVEDEMVQKADGKSHSSSPTLRTNVVAGMFLWIHLIMLSLEGDVHTVREFRDLVNETPSGLYKA